MVAYGIDLGIGESARSRPTIVEDCMGRRWIPLAVGLDLDRVDVVVGIDTSLLHDTCDAVVCVKRLMGNNEPATIGPGDLREVSAQILTLATKQAQDRRAE